MISDWFKNIARYAGIPHVREIEKFIASRDCSRVPNGEIEILGRDLFVRVAEYETGAPDQKQFEAHTVYADLQLMVTGREIMEVSVERSPRPVTAYNEGEDIRFFEEPPEISSALVSAGQFTVFFPGELHKPGCHAGGSPEKVKKMVFKIRMPKDASL